jgi:hypothetical protein
MEFTKNNDSKASENSEDDYNDDPMESGKRLESMIVKFRTNEHENLLNKKYRLAGSGTSEFWESEDK